MKILPFSGLHPGLFFSNRPALKDSLGTGKDNAAVTLSCIGGSDDGSRVYFEWYKSGNLLKADSYRTMTTSGELKINPTDHTRDDGYYQCLITDKTWSVLSNMAELRLACKYHLVLYQICVVLGMSSSYHPKMALTWLWAKYKS